MKDIKPAADPTRKTADESPGTPPEGAGEKPHEAELESAREPPTKTETGGPKGPEPTRYGDWERKGRCIDF